MPFQLQLRFQPKFRWFMLLSLCQRLSNEPSAEKFFHGTLIGHCHQFHPCGKIHRCVHSCCCIYSHVAAANVDGAADAIATDDRVRVINIFGDEFSVNPNIRVVLNAFGRRTLNNQNQGK